MVSQVTKMSYPLGLEEARRFQYRLCPYLGNATISELEDRFDDVFRNIYRFTKDCKVAPVANHKGAGLWLQSTVDLQVELVRRGIDIREFGRFEEMPWNRVTLELMRSNPSVVSLVDRQSIFCKFGEHQWLSRTLELGELRLSPASYFKTDQHNLARRSDELAFESFVSPYHFDLGMIPSATLQRLPKRGWYELREEKPSDHLLYCVTTGFDFRHFVDFGAWPAPAEACLIVHDQEAFEDRLMRAAE
jgi:hypothetical protein